MSGLVDIPINIKIDVVGLPGNNGFAIRLKNSLRTDVNHTAVTISRKLGSHALSEIEAVLHENVQIICWYW